MDSFFYQKMMPVVMAIVGWMSLTVIYSIIISIGMLISKPLFFDIMMSKITFLVVGLGIFVGGIFFARFYVAKREQNGKPFHIFAIIALGGLFGIVIAQTFDNYNIIHVTVVSAISISIILLLYRRSKVK